MDDDSKKTPTPARKRESVILVLVSFPRDLDVKRGWALYYKIQGSIVAFEKVNVSWEGYDTSKMYRAAYCLYNLL